MTKQDRINEMLNLVTPMNKWKQPQAPGYYDQEKFVDRHTNMWTAVPVTLSFFDNMLSWDIMPGAMIDFNYGDDKKAVWGVIISSRNQRLSLKYSAPQVICIPNRNIKSAFAGNLIIQ